MFTMIREVGVRKSLASEAPCFGLSFLTAELLYKFHSFTLECLAFLATWLAVLVFSADADWARGMVRSSRRA